MYNLCRVLKTGILAELTARSGLEDIYTKMMTLIKLLCLFVYCLCLVLIMLTFDHEVTELFMLN